MFHIDRSPHIAVSYDVHMPKVSAPHTFEFFAHYEEDVNIITILYW